MDECGSVVGEESKSRVRFDSSRVCKSFLLSCCPHDILSSTVRMSTHPVLTCLSSYGLVLQVIVTIMMV